MIILALLVKVIIFNFLGGGNLSTAVLGCIPVTLPVELIYFEGDNYSVGNIIKWKTESENNSDYFELEWTSTPENENWVTINKQETYGPGNYGFVHNWFTRDAINYYRLSQVDNNGEEKYYDPIAINNKIPKKEIKKVYNLMGQEVDLHYQGLKIILYSDGSFEKRF